MLESLLLLIAVLTSGDVIETPLEVKYSGESHSWIFTENPDCPGETIEVEVIDKVTGFTIDAVTAPIDDCFTYTLTLPRVGLYEARARLCNDECSDWTTGPNLIFAILAPAGAPEL